MKQFECYVTYGMNKGLIKVENILGIGHGIIIFNPEIDSEGIVDHKLQSLDFAFFKDKQTGNMFRIDEIKEHFSIVGSKGLPIIDSHNLKDDAVEAFLIAMENGLSLKKEEKELN